MRHTKGSLFLLPSPITDQASGAISSEVIQILHRLDYFIVEKARTARRFISATKPERPIEVLKISEMPRKMADKKVIREQLQPLLEGHDVGILSEAGLPAIADPGNVYVAEAHDMGIRVVPVSGPSSILMALIGSGLEGQRFMFHGYLSAKREELEKQLPQLERQADRDDATQIWIEAPYRNHQVMDAAAKMLSGKRKFCIAAGLGGESGFVETKSIADWVKQGWPDIHKVPTVFLIR